MSSREEQTQQNTSEEGWRQKVAVKPQKYAGALSSSPAQVALPPRAEDQSELLEKTLERENMKRAYQRVKQNGGAPGVDGMTVTMLAEYLKINWVAIKEQLLQGTYCPQPVKRVEIPKPGGGMRALGIPTVLDRLIQQALLQKMTPIFDPYFSPESYGFRPGKRAHDAVRRAQEHIQSGYRFVVDLDLEKFFDRVNHDMLMARVARRVADKRVLKLIRAYLNVGVMANGIVTQSTEGTQQGGPLSPLLSNILLDDLDRELTRRGHKFVRYADDCNLFVKSKRAGIRVMASVSQFVEGKLKLKVNREKSAVDRPWKRKFLGFSFLNDRKATLRLAPQTLKRCKDKLRKLTNRTWSVAMEERIRQVNEYLRGWIGYFHPASAKKHCEELEQWLRRRLRMCLWKQWKRTWTRFCNLRALGVPEWAAWMMAKSNKGPWVMARNTNNALNVSYWERQGLMSLLEHYGRLRQSLGTAGCGPACPVV
jgi:group II intron reverse transcriptase/maturase